MATTEVADVITLVDCIKEANVYGVTVPGDFIGNLFFVTIAAAKCVSSVVCKSKGIRAE